MMPSENYYVINPEKIGVCRVGFPMSDLARRIAMQ